MKIAVEGCAHGELNKIYEAIERLEKQNNVKIDLLIICGDFQAVRNPDDLECMAVPPKYRKLNTFYEYYSGVKKAPVLTLFIGGNHEASNYLSELPYGGWVCPNIYYMGYANVINIGGVRIAGLSGIYKGRDYLRGHFECPPYDESSKKSVYHIRNVDVFRLKQIKKPIDIFISHDWPKGVYNFGNKTDLLRYKPFFKSEMDSNTLGSPPAEELLMKLKPSYWFAAHLHCKFAAIVPHSGKDNTKFLALDKCLPRRKFLQIIDIDNISNRFHIEFDLEWLSILHSTNHLLSVSRGNNYMPGNGCSERIDFSPSEEEIENVRSIFKGDMTIPNNFCVTAPCYDPSKQTFRETNIKPYKNPQTEKFCELLSVTDPVVVLLSKSNNTFSGTESSFDPNEITLSDSGDEIDTTNTDLDVSGCDDFFIDKTGDRCKRKSDEADVENYSFPEIKETNIETETDKSNISNGNSFKFKRRNLSLYKCEE